MGNFNYQEGNKEAIWVAQYDYEGRISNTGGGGVVSWGSAPAKCHIEQAFVPISITWIRKDFIEW